MTTSDQVIVMIANAMWLIIDLCVLCISIFGIGIPIPQPARPRTRPSCTCILAGLTQIQMDPEIQINRSHALTFIIHSSSSSFTVYTNTNTYGIPTREYVIRTYTTYT